MATVRVLGAFGANVGGGPADLGGPRQRSVLARLVAARGRMVPAERLVEDLWPHDPPPRAAAGLQSFVSHLRRALEPDRPPRTPARLLVTAPPGYALRLPGGAVDAWRFDSQVDEAATRLAAGDPDAARRAAESALEEWRGPAYAEFSHLPWAATEASRLEERHRLAAERRAEAMLELGAAAAAVPDLEAHAAAHPLREEAWRLLALALYRTGRQGDALAALRRARTALAEELGVDPGPALRRLEADVLAQSPDLAPGPGTAPAPREGERRPVLRLAPDPAGPLFVGRDAEQARLTGAAASAEAGQRTLVLVGGDAGMGKTALVERFASDLAARGWTAVWGRAPETGGAPAAWPWAELLRELASAAPPRGDLADRLAPFLTDTAPVTRGGDATSGRFRLHLAVGDYLAERAADAPLLVVLEDLHWADEETLALLSRLPGRLRGGPVLIVGTFRPTGIPDPLADALATLARYEPVRVELDGLADTEVAALVRATCSAPVDDADMAAIAARTGGNPFFTRETARLLEAEGPQAAVRGVPAGVGDVLRRRTARLPAPARTVLRYAAVLGRDADLPLLHAVCGGDADAVMEGVETAVDAGLLVETGPGGVGFAHALVRDTIYSGLSRVRRVRMHGEIAAVLERLRPGEAAAIAHHHLEAGAADPDRAVRHARSAAENAESRFAYGAAADLWIGAIEALRPQGDRTLRRRLELEVRAIKCSALAGRVMAARDRRTAALAPARSLGDVRLLARIIGSFDVPTLWTSRQYGTLDGEVVEAAEEALTGLDAADDGADGDDELRVRLLTTLAIELEGEQAGDRAVELSERALALARRIGRPELLALALNGRYLNRYRAAGDLPERRALATELLDLATEHGLVAYRVLAHLQLQHVAITDLDMAEARAQRGRGTRLAEHYGLPLLGLTANWQDGMEHLLAGRMAEAERAYEEIGAAIGRTGIWNSERGMAFVGAFCVRLVQGRAGELVEATRWVWETWPHAGAAADFHALALIALGRDAEAREVVRDAGEIRPDYLFDLSMSFRGLRAMALDDRPLAAAVYDALLPFEDHLTGGATGVTTIGPVAWVLAELAAFLDLPGAAGHRRRAAGIAARLGGFPSTVGWTADPPGTGGAPGTAAADRWTIRSAG